MIKTIERPKILHSLLSDIENNVDSIEYEKDDDFIPGVYSAITIANFIIEYTDKIENPVDNLRLQLILYFCQAYYLILYNGKKGLFKDDIYAEENGVIISDVYNEFKYNGVNPLTCLDVDESENGEYISEEDKNFISLIIEKYCRLGYKRLFGILKLQKPYMIANFTSSCITRSSIFQFYNNKLIR